MKKAIQRTMQIAGLLAVVLFCVNAAASIGDTHVVVAKSFSEPVNMMLIGIGLIAFGSFIKRRSLR